MGVARKTARFVVGLRDRLAPGIAEIQVYLISL